MTRHEALVFLSQGTRTGKLATVRADGTPHIVPIWFVLDGEDLLFNTGDSSVKFLNLKRDPRAAVIVDLEAAPYAYVLVEGTVSISDDLEEVRDYATRIGGRYMGEDRAEEFGARNGVPGEVLVRLRPDRIIAKDDISG